MKNAIGTTIVCLSFFSIIFAAENPNQSPFVTRGKDLGDTGAMPTSGTPRPTRSNSLQRAQTIRVTLPRKTSNEDARHRFHKSPRAERSEFNGTRNLPVVLPEQPFDFSKKPPHTPSYAEKK